MLNEHDESAFPVQIGNTVDELRGMSIVDYFAAQAMNGLLANNWLEREIPGKSYDIADAMMNERKRRYDERK